ncbi:MAG: hypothetical protein MI919_38035, partial [Holophagales bacterium]|nr:hypothetical protein [Holophagales bacterium]
AERRGRLGTQAVPLVALAVVLPAVMVALLMLRGQGLDGPWWGGLPAAVAVLLYGLFLLPLVISSLGYAWTFERWGLRREDLDLLRRRFPEPREVDDPAGVEGSGIEGDGGGAGEA